MVFLTAVTPPISHFVIFLQDFKLGVSVEQNLNSAH